MLRRSDVAELPLNLLVSHYLLASYCYYQLNQSPMTDDAFDYLCKRLLENYDSVDHCHKGLVDTGSLEAGTCLLGPLDYPLRVQIGAERYLRDCESGTLMAQVQKADTLPTVARRRMKRSVVREDVETTAAPKRVVRRARAVVAPAPVRSRILRRSRG